MRRFPTALAVAASLACASSALAAPTWYIGNDPNSRGSSFAGPIASWPHSDAEYAAWAASIAPGGDLIGSNLKALPTGTFTSTGLDVSFGPDVSATVNSGALIVTDVSTANGHYSTTDPGVDNFMLVYLQGLAFQFSKPTSAFGFYLTDMGDGGSLTTMTLYDNGTVVGSYQVSCSAGHTTNCVPVDADQNAAVSFIGVIDPTGSFDKVVFSNPGGTDAVAIDDLTIAAPEPASLAMLGGALLGLAMVRRRTRP